ncbi:hypothetical protein DDW44_12495 [Streptomyces tirandamycinicus]|uniref:Uncharacterized protein n=1 Tax=Streptomyces tirandamycinicus TaxID=2174846 RepID=A0A2S1SSY0_9ACTN|nr:hypothetical protein DDW44_12495 [Streptomyces tirandamycinicus]
MATNDTDATQCEYVTYAPAGQTCPACNRPINELEPCRRGAVERASGAPVVVYRHAERCPA